MSFNLSAAVAGFVNEYDKVKKQQTADALLKLKTGEAQDKHDLTQAQIYKIMSGGKGSAAKPMTEYQRAMLGDRHAKAQREADKFELQKQGKWNPSGRTTGGAIQIPSVDSAYNFGGSQPPPATRSFTPAVGATNDINTSAVPAPEDTEAPAEADETEEEDDTTDDTDDTEQTPKMAAGGMASRPAVGYYADGGTAQQFPPVQDNDASQTAVSQPAVGDPAPLPASPPPTPPPPPAASASKKGWNNSIGFNTSEVIDSWKNAPEPEGWSKQGAVGEAPKKDPTDVNPVRFGLAAMQEAYSTSKGASALDKGHSAMVEAVTKKPNAMSDAQYQQIAKVVDPHDELTENARLIASLNAGVKNALSKGDVKSAKALAVGMVEMSAINSEKFGRYAMELMQKGDAQGAVTFLQKAYDVMPDGKKIEAFIGPDNLVHARTIDSDGNAQDLGKFGGPQLVKLATGVANGSTYWQTMSQIAGMKPDKPTQQPKPMGVPKLSDRTNAAKNIEDAASGFELGKETEGTVKSIASQIHVSNDADPAMSIRAALKLTDAKNAPDYKLTPSQDGSATAEFKDGSVIKLSRNALAQIALARASAQKGKEAADAKTAEEQAQEKKKQGLISDLQTQQAAERDKQRSKVMTPGAIGRGAYIPELNRPPQ